MADEDAVDGIERKRQIMLTNEFVVQLLDPELAFSAQSEDQGLLLGKDLLGREPLRPSARLDQSGSNV